MPTISAGSAGSYTFTGTQTITITCDPAEVALWEVSRAGRVVASSRAGNDQVIGPFQAGDVLTITAARGAIDYTVNAYDGAYALTAAQVSATQALVSGAGKNSVMVIGDSWGARHYSVSGNTKSYADIGALSWAQALSGQKLSIVNPDAALGGTTSQDWVSGRLETYLAGYSPGWIVCFLGINDVSNDVPLATTQANLTAIYDRCLATGAKLIIADVGPYGSTYVVTGETLAQKTAKRTLLNTWIANYVATHSNCWLLPQYAALVDASNVNGYMLGAYNDTVGTTGLHTTAAGSRAVGQLIANIWAAVGVADAGLHATGYVDSFDYDATAKNRISNPMMLGTGGSNTPGAGTTITPTTIAASWTVATAAGGASTTVCTTAARTLAADGDTVGQNQVLTITGANANDVVSLRTGSISTRFAEGDIVEAEMFVRVTGASGLKGIRLLMNSIQGGVTFTSTGMSYPSAGVSYDQADAAFVIKTPPLSIGPGALSGHILTLDIAFAGAGGAVVRAGRASWRKLN